MTANDVYQIMCEYASCPPVTFCQLHECCFPQYCSSPQQYRLVNFDTIKSTYCKVRRINPLPSVDGLIANNNNICCFIEAKSWQQIQKHKQNLTGQDIHTQVQHKFKLAAKIASSLHITQHILKDQYQRVNQVPIIYVVVSDADIDKGEQQINSMLNYLSQLSSNDMTEEYQQLAQVF